MSSDLPTALPTGRPLARSYAAYMDDPQRISAEVRIAGAKAPSIAEIKGYVRDRKMKPYRIPEPPFGAHEAHDYARQTADMAPRSRLFVALLERERAMSAEWAKAQGALRSTALAQPEHVNRAWDRETERAWLANEELGPCE
jgi:hypothetical protein